MYISVYVCVYIREQAVCLSAQAKNNNDDKTVVNDNKTMITLKRYQNDDKTLIKR